MLFSAIDAVQVYHKCDENYIGPTRVTKKITVAPAKLSI